MDFRASLEKLSNHDLSTERLFKYIVLQINNNKDIGKKWEFIAEYLCILEKRQLINEKIKMLIIQKAEKIIGVSLENIVLSLYLFDFKKGAVM